MNKTTMLVMLAGLGMMLPSFAHANALSNPGFETNSFQSVETPFAAPINLSIWGITPEVARSTAVKHNGNYSLEIDANAPAKRFKQVLAGITPTQGFEQITAYSPNFTNSSEVAVFSIYAINSNSSANSSFTEYVRFLTSNDSLITYGSNDFTSGNAWTQETVEATVPSGTAYVQVIVATATTTNADAGYFDDADLEYA